MFKVQSYDWSRLYYYHGPTERTLQLSTFERVTHTSSPNAMRAVSTAFGCALPSLNLVLTSDDGETTDLRRDLT